MAEVVFCPANEASVAISRLSLTILSLLPDLGPLVFDWFSLATDFVPFVADLAPLIVAWVPLAVDFCPLVVNCMPLAVASVPLVVDWISLALILVPLEFDFVPLEFEFVPLAIDFVRSPLVVDGVPRVVDGYCTFLVQFWIIWLFASLIRRKILEKQEGMNLKKDSSVYIYWIIYHHWRKLWMERISGSTVYPVFFHYMVGMVQQFSNRAVSDFQPAEHLGCT